jgi:hypothetical protein
VSADLARLFCPSAQSLTSSGLQIAQDGQADGFDKVAKKI